MKVAKEKVWIDEKGNLVPDGHEDAAVLVATKGQTVSDAHVEQYKGVNKFFEDANFDSNAQHVMPKTITSEKPVPQPVYNMTDDHGMKVPDNKETVAEGPKPQNRESLMPKRRTRSAKKKKKGK